MVRKGMLRCWRCDAMPVEAEAADGVWAHQGKQQRKTASWEVFFTGIKKKKVKREERRRRKKTQGALPVYPLCASVWCGSCWTGRKGEDNVPLGVKKAAGWDEVLYRSRLFLITRLTVSFNWWRFCLWKRQTAETTSWSIRVKRVGKCRDEVSLLWQISKRRAHQVRCFQVCSFVVPSHNTNRKEVQRILFYVYKRP